MFLPNLQDVVILLLLVSLPVEVADGRYVALQSEATNLVPDDINDYRDVFVLGGSEGPAGLPGGGAACRRKLNPLTSCGTKLAALTSSITA
ncbi:hypothetical protein ACFL59_06170 [Planctomycetota bacterium]